ncbi:hypothetical protein DFP73DRAFT_539840 [Morchella snyderi]|nr:hypothetical protein DFP73DRAFT_539840 [Morchella snyderi]
MYFASTLRHLIDHQHHIKESSNMFHLLPSEIVAEIISHASDRYPITTTPLTQFPEHQTQKSLAVLCRVCKSFHAHAVRLLYAAVKVQDLKSSLIHSGSLATHASLVRSLTILEFRTKGVYDHEPRPYTSNELQRWSKLEDAVECMENIESIVYEVDHLSPRLSAALSKRPILRHLTTPNYIPFLLDLPPTQSLSVYWFPHRAKEVASLQSLITRSAKILRKLYLSPHFVNDEEVPELLEAVFFESHRIPLSELVLDLPSFTPAMAKTLVGAIDISSLVRLDLQWSRMAGHLLDALIGQVKSLRWLRVEGAAAPFIASFSGLEELYWTTGYELPADIAALTQHGASLRTLAIVDTKYITSEDVQVLISACQKLEVLEFKVDYNELELVAASLASLKALKELYISSRHELGTLTLPSGPYYFRPCRFGRLTSKQHELFLLYPFLPYIVDGIDAAVGILLVGGVSCPDISVAGIVPPYHGLFHHTLTWGRGDAREKRWVKNGTAETDSLLEAFRGGNPGDRYKCEGVEGEWELMSSLRWINKKPEPLGKRRVPFCCTRSKGKVCKPRR